MATEKYFLHGGGGHASVVIDSLTAQGIEVIGIFDPAFSTDRFGIKALGKYDEKLLPGIKGIVAIGNNEVRRNAVSKMKHSFGTVVDSSALVSSTANIAEGTMVLHGVIIQTMAKVGRHVILNTRCQLDHDCTVGDFAHIGPGAVLCGSVSVGEGTLIGAGVVVVPNITIGQWATVGAGAVVINNIPDGAVVAGNPARTITKH